MKKLIVLMLVLMSLFLIACHEKKENIEASTVQESKGSVYSSFKANWQGDTLANLAELPEYVYQEGDQFNIFDDGGTYKVSLTTKLTLNGEPFSGVINTKIQRENATGYARVIFVDGFYYPEEGVTFIVNNNKSLVKTTLYLGELESFVKVSPNRGQDISIDFMGEIDIDDFRSFIASILANAVQIRDMKSFVEDLNQIGNTISNKRELDGVVNAFENSFDTSGLLNGLIFHSPYEEYGMLSIQAGEDGYFVTSIETNLN